MAKTLWETVKRLEAERSAAFRRVQELDRQMDEAIRAWREGRDAPATVTKPKAKVTKVPTERVTPRDTGGPQPFTKRVESLFEDHPQLKARDVLVHLKMKVTPENMDKAKRALQKLFETKRVTRLEKGLYEGR